MKQNRRRSVVRGIWTLVLGFLLGGLMTYLAESFLPESAARSFLTASVSPSVGPFSLDFLSVALTMGPLSLAVNVLTLAGVAIMAFIIRAWL